jgi:hypothetical protein
MVSLGVGGWENFVCSSIRSFSASNSSKLYAALTSCDKRGCQAGATMCCPTNDVCRDAPTLAIASFSSTSYLYVFVVSMSLRSRRHPTFTFSSRLLCLNHLQSTSA